VFSVDTHAPCLSAPSDRDDPPRLIWRGWSDCCRGQREQLL
jgi:hypothetical protein